MSRQNCSIFKILLSLSGSIVQYFVGLFNTIFNTLFYSIWIGFIVDLNSAFTFIFTFNRMLFVQETVTIYLFARVGRV